MTVVEIWGYVLLGMVTIILFLLIILLAELIMVDR